MNHKSKDATETHDTSLCHTNEAERATEAWDKWSSTHNRENYGRCDAFLAGYAAHAERVRGLVEALGNYATCPHVGMACAAECGRYAVAALSTPAPSGVGVQGEYKLLTNSELAALRAVAEAARFICQDMHFISELRILSPGSKVVKLADALSVLDREGK